MWISNTSIKRPVFATMVILSFMVLGIVSMSRLGVDLFPSVNFPFITVTVPYPGAAPEEVETLVTRPIEDAVAGINGVKRIESHSRESFAQVGIELRLEVDAQQAAAEVREKVAAIRDSLPRQIEDPTIQRFDVAALPVMVFAVGSSAPSDVTRRTVEDKLKPLIEQIDGVAAVQVNGGEVREIQVNLDPGRLEALGLPVSVVADKLSFDNLDMPAGKVVREGRNIALRTKGEFKAASEIENVILRSTGGSTVRVKDVGTVVDGYKERESTTRLNGRDAVSFAVRKQSGANTVEISRKVLALLARVAPTFPDLTISPIHDDADFIKSNVEQVREHIIFGGAMAVFVIFVFMRDWRSTLITALALPDLGHRHVLLHVCRGVHHQHDDADGALARHRHPHRRCGGRAREHLPAHGNGRRRDDRGAQRHVADRPRRHGDDVHDPGRVPAGRLHDGDRRAVLQVLRADNRLRGGHVAARRVHARPDAVVALRALHPRGRAPADARRPLLRAHRAPVRQARCRLSHAFSAGPSIGRGPCCSSPGRPSWPA